MSEQDSLQRVGEVTVSVIIPAYNSADYLGDALASVFAQTVTDYEVIVVNDGSSDSTEEVALQHEGRIRYIAQVNAGPGAARNRGIEVASGRYIAFLDADDLWMPEKLKTQLAFMETHPEVGLTAVNYDYLVNGEVYPRPRWKLPVKEPWWVPPRIFGAYRRGYAPSTPATMVRSELLRSIGGFPTNVIYGEDVWTWFRIGMRSGWAFCDAVLGRIRNQPQSLTMRRGFDAHASNLLFSRLHSLALEKGTEADLEDWRFMLYRAMKGYTKRAVLGKRIAEARDLLVRWKGDLKCRHRFMLELLLLCEFPLRLAHRYLRSVRNEDGWRVTAS